MESFPQVLCPYTLKSLTGFESSTLSPPKWKRCWTSCHQSDIAFSCSVMRGSIALATMASRLRKSLAPLESQGLTTSVAPMFSMRTERFDSQLCWKGCQTPCGDRQLRPSIVPPCGTEYSARPEEIS